MAWSETKFRAASIFGRMKLKTDPFTRLQHIHHISKHATAGSNNQDEDIRASDTVECFYFFGLIASRVPLIYLFF